MWIHSSKPVKLSQLDKEKLHKKVNDFIISSIRLKKEVNRIDIRNGRIYFYHLVEQFFAESSDVQFVKPLIDNKYLEFPMSRITLYDKNGSRCTADWLRHTGQYYELIENNLDQCLLFIEENPQWF